MTYQIKSHRETANNFLTKQHILQSQLERCFFKIGDKVKFKKPRRNPIYGTITHIEECWDLVTWTHGGMLPNNISINVEGVPTTVKTNMKRIIFDARS